MPTRTPGAFSITASLHKRFAELSGDWNPIHVNPVEARRTQIGRPIVHGVHSVLRILEALARVKPGLPAASKISVSFPAPVFPGDSCAVSIEDASQDRLRVRARVGEIVVVDTRVELGSPHDLSTIAGPLRTEDTRHCRVWSLHDMASASGVVLASSGAAEIARAFPKITKWLGVGPVMGLMCVSKLVGMECPGRYSILAGFDVALAADALQPRLAYRVLRLNQQFRSLKIDIDGFGMHGNIQALATNPPVAQVSMSELADKVGCDEFRGQRALIVGGSRGLGEVTAKLIAAGGGVPVITYATGKKDAERVADEIRHAGGRCEILRYNVLTPAAPQLRLLKLGVSSLYYYATPPVFVRNSTTFDPERLSTFERYYVKGFDGLCRALLRSSRSLAAFYPSSVAIDERRPEMREYAEAKAAGEALCAHLSATFSSVHLLVERLPRMLTDQTATPVPTKTADSVEILLPIIRKLSALSADASHNDSSS